MGQRKFTLYKDIKIGRGWQKVKAAFYSNGKIKPNIVIYKGKEQEHPEGAFYANDRGKWIFAGKDALEAQRFRAELLDRHEIARLKGEPLQPTPAPAVTKGTPLKEAMDTWLANLEAQGRDVKTIRTYRAAVAPFVSHCKVKTVEECRDNKQVMFDYMAWLRKQPKTKRRNANPQRTYSNKLGHVACFLSHFGVKTGLKKAEYPQYEDKTVTAYTDEELDYLYSRADEDRGFLLDPRLEQERIAEFRKQLDTRIALEERLAAEAGPNGPKLEQERSELERQARHLVDAIAQHGYSSFLSAQLAVVESRLREVERLLSAKPAPKLPAIIDEQIREFLGKESEDFCELLKSDPETARQEIQKRINKLVLTPRETSNGAMLEVTGDIELLRTGDAMDESPLDGTVQHYTLPRIPISMVLDPNLHLAA